MRIVAGRCTDFIILIGSLDHYLLNFIIEHGVAAAAAATAFFTPYLVAAETLLLSFK